MKQLLKKNEVQNRENSFCIDNNYFESCQYKLKVIPMLDGLLNEQQSAQIKEKINTCTECFKEYHEIKKAFKQIEQEIVEVKLDPASYESILNELSDVFIRIKSLDRFSFKYKVLNTTINCKRILKSFVSVSLSEEMLKYYIICFCIAVILHYMV